jgi:outer membrane immunogenic protein
MRTVWLAVAASISSVSVPCEVFAADESASPPIFQPYTPPIVQPYIYYRWTGFYLGANAGSGWASGTLTDNFTGASLSASQAGFIGGGQAGYNYQWANFVLGAEWNIDEASLRATRSTTRFDATANTRLIDTLAARFGWAFGELLWYGKAGGGFANNNATITDIATGASITGSNTSGGWLLGTGLEYLVTPNWTIKAEYDYLGLESWSMNSTLFAPNSDRLSINRNIQMLIAGFNFKF